MKDNRQRQHLRGVRFNDHEKEFFVFGKNATNASSIPAYLRESGIVRARSLTQGENASLIEPHFDRLLQQQAELRISISRLQKLRQCIDTGERHHGELVKTVQQALSVAVHTEFCITQALGHDH